MLVVIIIYFSDKRFRNLMLHVHLKCHSCNLDFHDVKERRTHGMFNATAANITGETINGGKLRYI